MGYNETLMHIRHCNLINMQPIVGNMERVKKLMQLKLLSSALYIKALDVYEIANEIYPGQCDLQLVPVQDSRRYTYQFRLVIHFPILELKNSKGQHLTIKDFFFAIGLRMKANQIIISDFSGNRTTFSYIEAVSNYKFSHLSTNSLSNLPIYTHFCFGEGDISLLQVRFNQTNPRDKNTLRLLLFNIESYLCWESLEGGPYIKIENIFNQSRVYNPDRYSDSTMKQLVDKLVDNYLSELDCDVIFRQGVYQVSENQKLNDSLVTIINGHYSSDQRKSLLFLKGSDGTLYEVTQQRNIPNLNDQSIVFQQRQYRYTIVDSENQPTESEIFYINPLFKSYVKSNIERKFSEKISESNFVKQLQDQVEI